MFSQYFLNHLFASKTNSFKASVQHIFLYELFEFRKLNNIVFLLILLQLMFFHIKIPFLFHISFFSIQKIIININVQYFFYTSYLLKNKFSLSTTFFI